MARGDATGWFDEVYQRADRKSGAVPWACMEPRPAFAEWLMATNLQGDGKKALVVACGLGDDSEALADRGFAVTAFDIAPTAIEWCHERWPDSSVEYLVADMFDPPYEWLENYDFVVEDFTVQALPLDIREKSIAAITQFVAPGGTLLLICIGTDSAEERSGPPWPLTREEVALFARDGLVETRFEELPPSGNSAAVRWRVEFKREK
ncbi:class I SAM-dependent methyltransferase [Chloroflexi bacterium TSY]|nr:class I SAM-dependent methyltransferase [Chloroflexi bacterium TSY]